MCQAKTWGRQMLQGDRGYVQVPSPMMINYQAGWRRGWTLWVSGRGKAGEDPVQLADQIVWIRTPTGATEAQRTCATGRA